MVGGDETPGFDGALGIPSAPRLAVPRGWLCLRELGGPVLAGAWG